MKNALTKNKDKILFLIFMIIASSVLSVYGENAFYNTTDDFETNGITVLESDMDYIQQVHFNKKIKLTEFSLQFGTFEKDNQGELIVQFFGENHSLVQEWNMDTAFLTDNAYQEFYFDQPYIADKDAVCYILVREEYTGDNALALYMFSPESAADVALANEAPLNDQAICYKLTYQDSNLSRSTMLVCGLILVLFTALILLRLNETTIMICVLITVGLAYMCVLSPNAVPDEANHFFRAFEVSCGYLKSDHIKETGEGGRELPVALLSFSDNSAVLDWNNLEEISLFNTALYAPVSYLPQALAIRIARLFTQNVMKLFYAGRFGNFIVSLILSIWALRKIPVGRRIIFLMMVFPITVQEMISMSPDSFTNALSFTFISLILAVSYGENERIKRHEITAIILLGISISLCKIVYVVLIALIFMIPNEKIGGKKQWKLFKFGIPAMALIFNLLWLKISSAYLIEVTPGVNPKEQVFFILRNIAKYYRIAIHTVIQLITGWIQQMIGTSLGWYDIPIAQIVWVGFLLLLLHEVYICRMKFTPHRNDKVIFILTFLCGVGLIATSEYVSWTVVGKEIIEGIQGRYFIPLLPCLAFFVVWHNNTINENGKDRQGGYSPMLSLMLNCISVFDILHHYM